MPAVDQVQYGVEGGVGTITLNNPSRNNAWNPDMERQYFGRLDQAADDDGVRAIVVTGAGSSFCPGLDSQRLGTRPLPPAFVSRVDVPSTTP